MATRTVESNWFARNHGVITFAEARSLGLSSSAIGRRVEVVVPEGAQRRGTGFLLHQSRQWNRLVGELLVARGLDEPSFELRCTYPEAALPVSTSPIPPSE